MLISLHQNLDKDDRNHILHLGSILFFDVALLLPLHVHTQTQNIKHKKIPTLENKIKIQKHIKEFPLHIKNFSQELV